MRVFKMLFMVFMAIAVIIFTYLILLDINILMSGLASNTDAMRSITLIAINAMGISVTIFYSYHMFIKECRNDIEAEMLDRYRDKLHGFIKSNKYQGRT